MLRLTHPLQLVMGLIIWSVWFVVIYGGMSVGCAVAEPDAAQGPWTWINAMVLLLTFATTALLTVLAYRCWQLPANPAHNRFIARVAATVYLFAAASTLAVGLPAIVLPPCV